MTVQQKIKKATEVFEQHGESLGDEPVVARLMRELEAHCCSSWRSMEETGIVAACRQCEEEEGGSCCGSGIEDRYSEILLLLNLLWDVALPEDRLFQDSCYFLGDSGCRLKIRDVLCVNYLCTAVQKRLTPTELSRVQQAVGCELDTVFLLQETVKKILKSRCGVAIL